MKRGTSWLVALPLVVLSLPGCGRGDTPLVVASTTLTSATMMDDAQIAEVARAALAELADQADLVRRRAATPALRDFSLDTVTDYRGLLQRETELRHVLGLVPTRSAVSQDIADDARAKRQVLVVEAPVDFDVAAIQTQTATLAAAVNLVDTSLLPGVQDPRLRAMLLDLRRSVAFHLEDARRLEAMIEADSLTHIAPAP